MVHSTPLQAPCCTGGNATGCSPALSTARMSAERPWRRASGGRAPDQPAAAAGGGSAGKQRPPAGGGTAATALGCQPTQSPRSLVTIKHLESYRARRWLAARASGTHAQGRCHQWRRRQGRSDGMRRTKKEGARAARCMSRGRWAVIKRQDAAGRGRLGGPAQPVLAALMHAATAALLQVYRRRCRTESWGSAHAVAVSGTYGLLSGTMPPRLPTSTEPPLRGTGDTRGQGRRRYVDQSAHAQGAAAAGLLVRE